MRAGIFHFWSAMLPLALGCSSPLRVVPEGPPPADARATIGVEYPPPSAKVESLGKDPGEPCAWMDGHWNWVRRRWQWSPGEWVIAPPRCHRTRQELKWVADVRSGQLFFTPPMWQPDSGQGVCPPPISCKASAGAGP